jgi:hypothetical protein
MKKTLLAVLAVATVLIYTQAQAVNCYNQWVPGPNGGPGYYVTVCR